MSHDLLSPVWARPDEKVERSTAEWEALLGQARRSRLLGRLARHYSDRGRLVAVPERPRRILEGALRLVERQHQEVEWEVACILRALHDTETPVVLLKGAAYFAARLPPSRGRLFSDIDIMVSREALPGVEGALFRAGWIGAERDAYNQRYYRQWMHELPPLKHVQRGTVLDVHHTITPPTSRFAVDGASLLRHAVQVDGLAGAHVLSPADMVLHSAVHLFQEGEFDHGLRDLLDLNDLLLHFQATRPGFWTCLFERARFIGLGEPLFHALQQIEMRFGTVPPVEFGAWNRDLRPGLGARTLLRPLFQLALRPHHPSSDLPFSGVARSLLYFRAHLLRMPLRLVVPHLLRKGWMRRFPQKDAA